MADSDRARFLRNIQETIDNCIRLSQTDSSNVHTSTIQRLVALERNIEDATGHILDEGISTELLSVTSTIVNELQTLRDNAHGSDMNVAANAYQTNRFMQSAHGAPMYHITREQLEFLSKFSLTAPMMAEVMKTSESTIRRRLRLYGIKLRDGCATAISDDDLDQKVREIIGTNKRIGPNSIRLRLRADNIIVFRQRVRDSCHRVDPGGSALRAVERRNVRRRKYRVAAPNSLWHIDGNHKLIRWQFVIHGAIDGFSRMVTFMCASDNNKASTVMSLFSGAIGNFGCPSRIRVDRGIENNNICKYMDEHRGLGRGSAIRGKSCHNQRIERLWVDVWDCVSNEYYDIFVFLEDQHTLDITNPAHMWVLHYVFLPRLNNSLQQFVHQYNSHNLSTEHSQTPNQLFIMGIMNNFNSNHCAIQQLVHGEVGEEFTGNTLPEDYGADGDENEEDSDEERDDLQSLHCPLADDALINLRDEVDPMERRGDVAYGLTLFKKAIEFV